MKQQKRRGRPRKNPIVTTPKKVGRPRKNVLTPVNKKPTAKQVKDNLLAENLKLTEWTLLWKKKYETLEQDYTQAKVMYLNSQAVIAYLEEKIAQLVRR